MLIYVVLKSCFAKSNILHASLTCFMEHMPSLRKRSTARPIRWWRKSSVWIPGKLQKTSKIEQLMPLTSQIDHPPESMLSILIIHIYICHSGFLGSWKFSEVPHPSIRQRSANKTKHIETHRSTSKHIENWKMGLWSQNLENLPNSSNLCWSSNGSSNDLRLARRVVVRRNVQRAGVFP